METVTITAKISENKRIEFFQSMETLKNIVAAYCDDLEINAEDDNSLVIIVTFSNKDELVKNFFNYEFNILMGSIKSLCDFTTVKVNNISLEQFLNG